MFIDNLQINIIKQFGLNKIDCKYLQNVSLCQLII